MLFCHLGSTVSTVPNEQQVFVGSLPLEFNRETLIEFFSKYGTVLDAKTYTPTHDSKKVGFIFLNLTLQINNDVLSMIEFWLCRF